MSELRNERYHAGSATQTAVAAPSRDASSTSINGKNLLARKVVPQFNRLARCFCLAPNSSNKKNLESRRVVSANNRVEGDSVRSHLPLRHSTKAIVERIRREGAEGIIRELCNWRSGSIRSGEIFRMNYRPPEPSKLRIGEHVARVVEMKIPDQQPFSFSDDPRDSDGSPRLQLTGMVVAAQCYFKKYGSDIKFLDTSSIQSTHDHGTINTLAEALVTSLESLPVNKAVGLITPSNIGLTLDDGHAVPLLITKTGDDFFEIVNLDTTPNHRAIKIALPLHEGSEEIKDLTGEQKMQAISERYQLILEQNVYLQEYKNGYLPEIITNKLQEKFAGIIYSELSTIRQADNYGCMTDAIVILKEALHEDRDDPNPVYQHSRSDGDPKLKPSMLKTSQRTAFLSSQGESGSTIFSARKNRALSDHKVAHSLAEPSFTKYTIDGAGKNALLRKLEESHKPEDMVDVGEHVFVDQPPKYVNRFLRIKTIKLVEAAMLDIQGKGSDATQYIHDLKRQRVISSASVTIQ